MKKIPIREQGLIGTLFQPNQQEKLSAIILVPGSDGGIPEVFAEKIATEGYIVFALGYFGLTGLPEYLENIPLEYFQKAFQWLKKQNPVDENQITMMGYSRGGELVLLFGTLFPDLMKAIVSYVPSSIVCGGLPHPNKPAWLYKNKPILPFLSGLSSKEDSLTEWDDLFVAHKSGKIPFHANTADDPYELSDLFHARNQENDILNTAAIPVEKIRCPLLILSGDEDKIWPSAYYGKRIMDRLSLKKSSIVRKHIAYPHAGHGIAVPFEGPIYHPVGKFWCTLGGTPEGNANACKQSWEEVLNFLKVVLTKH